MKLKLPGKWGVTLLAVWLIGYGLIALLESANPTLDKVWYGLAVAAGVLLILDR